MRLKTPEFALAGAAGLAWWLLYRLTIRHGQALARIEQLERKLKRARRRARAKSTPESSTKNHSDGGAVLPDFELPDLDGQPLTLSQFRGWRVLLIFFDPRSRQSQELLPGLSALQADQWADTPVPFLVSSGDLETNRRVMQEHGVRWPVAIQQHREVAELYGVFDAPAGCLVDEQGAAASPLVFGPEALLGLARGRPARPVAGTGPKMGQPGADRLTSRSPKKQNGRPGVAVGQRIPGVRLPRLDGGEATLDEYRGRPLLIVFSEPDCEPCERLLPVLQQVHLDPTAPEVLVISRDDPQLSHQQAARHGLTFPILLQRHWEVSRQFGRPGAPVGYLVDGEGILVRDPATGVDAILDLAAASTGDRRNSEVHV